MMHTLGFRHEQSRGDRDKYITVQIDNVKKKARHNFNKANTLNKTPYDLSSIMQYFLTVSVHELNKKLAKHIAFVYNELSRIALAMTHNPRLFVNCYNLRLHLQNPLLYFDLA